jgi:hypothetical protein
MGARKTTEQFIEDAKAVHGDKYDYSLVEYVDWKTKVEVICKSCNITFKISPNNHTRDRGCKQCGVRRRVDASRMKLDDFINKSKQIHGDKYDYSETLYTKNSEEVEIICKIHGKFKQIANAHKQGCGCTECGVIKNRENPTGWSHTNWQKASEKSKDFDSFKVYVIRCWNEEEEFYKIGKTYLKINQRFSSKKSLPYNWEILKEFILDNSKKASSLEHKLKIDNKIYHYRPNKNFGGKYEYFTKELPIQEILKL